MRRKVTKPKRSYISKFLQQLGDFSNLLKRTVVTEPFQAMSSDITELEYGGGKAYLCIHKDVQGQLVYGVALGLRATAELVLESYEQAIAQIEKLRGFLPQMLCHQDQGSQYTSYAYVDRVQQDKLILSYSRAGTPTDNPGQESFFGRFKDLWKDELLEISTFEQLEEFVTEKLKYYNEERYHTSIGRVTPLEYTKSYLDFAKNSSP